MNKEVILTADLSCIGYKRGTILELDYIDEKDCAYCISDAGKPIQKIPRNRYSLDVPEKGRYERIERRNKIRNLLSQMDKWEEEYKNKSEGKTGNPSN